MIDTTNDNGVRGDKSKCHYCDHPVPGHTKTCHVPTKAVVVRLTMDIIVSEPQSWDDSLIESHMNESSSCANNWMDIRIAKSAGCFCPSVAFEVLRDADENDMEDLPTTIPEVGK